MITGPTTRSYRTQKRYLKWLRDHKTTDCAFCQLPIGNNTILQETNYFWVVANAFAYSTWDDMVVKAHNMIIPKRHIVSLSQLTNPEQQEYVRLLITYESKGFSPYSRAATNIAKSIAHQHTHLLLLTNHKISHEIYMRKPLINWHW